MKKLLILVICIFYISAFLAAQTSPKGINYQAIARDTEGEILKGKTIALQLSLKTEQPTEQVFYVEIHRVTTNQFGLFNLVIGEGETIQGDFAEVPWSSEDILMESAMDTKGGNNFKVINTSKLLAVPYAFHANTASSFSNNFQVDESLAENSLVDACATDDCECDGGYTELKLYYFGDDDVLVEVFTDFQLTNPITEFNNVMDGDLLVVDASALPGGVFGTNTFFKVTTLAGDECRTTIYTDCPKPVYPGALDDLQILGKTYGNFTVFSHTDFGNGAECVLSDTNLDWHVGGNFVDANNNRLGTRNNERLVLITHDSSRVTITNSGSVGVGTGSPTSKLDVAGDTRVQESLIVGGVTAFLNATPSTSSFDGALTVAGGAGVGENLNVALDGRFGNDISAGNNLSVDNEAAITNDLTVGGSADVTMNMEVGGNSFVGDDLTVGNNANIQNNLGVTDDALIGRDLEVVRDAKIGDDLDVIDNVDVGGNLDVANSVTIGNDLTITDNLTVEVGGLVRIDDVSQSNNITSGALVVDGGIGIGKNLNVGGSTTTECITITGGCDFAENFDVNAASNLVAPEPGLLVSIDPKNPGQLMVCAEAYDKKLAGIISGANGVAPGMVMRQEGNELTTGAYPIALTGRVFVKTDAQFGAIEPGDMLTSSSLPGVAMKVTDFEKAHGAVIGKAMTSLEKGQGYVLVLVNLQ